MASGVRPFDVRAVEEKWRARWRDARCHEIGERSGTRPFYNFVGGPFPNGPLHMGHVRTFALGDVVARHLRMRGYDVLQCFEFDAFGLPNELAADAAGVSPASLTAANIATMREQMEELGFGYDWRHVHETCDPRYYRGTQELFVLLWHAGLVYRAMADLDHCPSCRTTLAHMQVIRGRCWRCDTDVQTLRTRQWFIRLSAYNEVLHHTVDDLTSWSSAARGKLRSVIGRTEGFEVDLPVVGAEGTSAVVSVFTVDPAVFGRGCELVAGPTSRRIEELLGTDLLTRLVTRSRREARDPETPARIDTGLRARDPVTTEPLPILVSAAHDGRFATGVVASADRASGPRSPDASGGVSAAFARPAVYYRVHDWLVSRQRRWGTPVPMVDCARCGDVPLPFVGAAWTGDEAVGDHSGTTRCPRCGDVAAPDPDTLDCFFDVVWCFIACSAELDDRPVLDRPVAHYPVDWFHNGMDSFFYLHLYRFLGRVLHERGKLPSPEPIARYDGHGTVLVGGRKMSKHHGTVVAPGPIVATEGADVLRLHVLGSARPGHDVEWSSERIDGARRLVDDVWRLVEPRADAVRDAAGAGPVPPGRIGRRVLHAERRITALLSSYHISGAVEELRLLVAHLTRADRRSPAGAAAHRDDERRLCWAAERVVRLVAPFCPHVAEELWERVGGVGLVALAPWPDGTEDDPSPSASSS